MAHKSTVKPTNKTRVARAKRARPAPKPPVGNPVTHPLRSASRAFGGANGSQSALPIFPTADEHLDISTLETWLWDAACTIRGATDAPKFKDFILPLIFYKRLSDVFDDEIAGHITEFGDEATARDFIEVDHADALRTGRKPIVRFFIPAKYRWDALRHHPADGALGEFLTDAVREIARLNPDLQGVLDIKDFNERQSGQRTLDDDRLAALVEVVSRHRLGLTNTEPDILGRAYEYLLRKFAEGQGQSAGEFYTPKEVGWLMAELMNPAPYSTAYDPACGSAGLPIKLRLVFERNHPDQHGKAPKLYGQELNPVTFAMAKMNMFLHDFTDSFFAIGDTFTKPGFVAEGAGLRHFDYAVANPMWNQDNYDEAFYEQDPWSRFIYGTPPRSSADWGWAQHILASLNDTSTPSGSAQGRGSGGRAAIVLDTGAVSRGSGSKSSNKEKEVRKAFVEHDFIEGVVLLPENLFYNTTAPGIILLLTPGIILLLNRARPAARKGQILLVNASAHFVKEKPKNRLTDDGISAVVDVYRKWETREKLSRVITLDEARAADYNLSPSQFVDVNDRAHHRPLAEITRDVNTARSAREKADAALAQVLSKLGLNHQERDA